MRKYLTPALLAAVLATACTRPATPTEETAAPPADTATAPAQPAATETPPPAAEARFVFDVQIGNALTPEGTLAAALTDFALSDTIHVAVTMHGDGNGGIRAELRDGQDASVEIQSTDVSGDSDASYMLSFPPGGPRSAGPHRILILLDDKPVWEKPLTLK